MAYVLTDPPFRFYAAVHGNFPELPEWFNPTLATNKPADPDLSAASSDELDAIELWMKDVDQFKPTPPPENTADGTPFTAHGNDAVANAKTYFATDAYKTWRFANWMERWTQWRYTCADALWLGKDTLSVSADPGQAGSGAIDGSLGIPIAT